MVVIVFLNWLTPGYILQAVMTGVALLMLWVWLAILLSHSAFGATKRALD
jgi:L-asparagine transporter-like permease